MYIIEIYQDKNGKSEIKEYLKNLQDKKDKDSRVKFTKIVSYIKMLEKVGLSLGKPYIKHIKNDIWELRPIRDRIFFAYVENNTFVLLSVFMKQTVKTPKREIENAERLLKEYKVRRDKNG